MHTCDLKFVVFLSDYVFLMIINLFFIIIIIIQTFEKTLNEKKVEMEKFHQLANNILMHAHPDVFENLSAWIKNFKSRYSTFDLKQCHLIVIVLSFDLFDFCKK